MKSIGKYRISFSKIIEKNENKKPILIHQNISKLLKSRIQIKNSKWIYASFKYNLIKSFFIFLTDIRILRELFHYHYKLIVCVLQK